MKGQGFFELLQPGLVIELGSHRFEAEEIKRFAGKFDPQPFHTDEAAAAESHFGRLCASGWHSCAVFMKLYIANWESAVRAATGWQDEIPERGASPGFRNLRWSRPVYADDTLTYRSTIKEARLSQSRVGWGLMQSQVDATNQDGGTVLNFTATGFIRVEDVHEA